MRKKTVTHSIKTIAWWILYLLPIIIYLLYVWGYARNGEYFDSLGTFIGENGFTYGNIIITSLDSIFGSDGLLPLFSFDSGIILYCSYLISMHLIHLAVDFILFIPRLCHKFMNKFTRSEDCE